MQGRGFTREARSHPKATEPQRPPPIFGTSKPTQYRPTATKLSMVIKLDMNFFTCYKLNFYNYAPTPAEHLTN